jgi:molecular chaperone DnaK
MLKESEGKGIDQSLLDAVKNAIDPVKEALKGTDAQAIKQATEKLTEAVYKLSAAIYEKAGAGAGANAQTGQEAGGGEHMDADFKVKDEDK